MDTGDLVYSGSSMSNGFPSNQLSFDMYFGIATLPLITPVFGSFCYGGNFQIQKWWHQYNFVHTCNMRCFLNIFVYLNNRKDKGNVAIIMWIKSILKHTCYTKFEKLFQVNCFIFILFDALTKSICFFYTFICWFSCSFLLISINQDES